LVLLFAIDFEFYVYSASESSLSIQAPELFRNKQSIFSYKYFYC